MGRVSDEWPAPRFCPVSWFRTAGRTHDPVTRPARHPERVFDLIDSGEHGQPQELIHPEARVTLDDQQRIVGVLIVSPEQGCLPF